MHIFSFEVWPQLGHAVGNPGWFGYVRADSEEEARAKATRMTSKRLGRSTHHKNFCDASH